MARRFLASAIVVTIVLARLLTGGGGTAGAASDLAIHGVMAQHRTVVRSQRAAAGAERATRSTDAGACLAPAPFRLDVPARSPAPPPVLAVAPAVVAPRALVASARAPPA